MIRHGADSENKADNKKIGKLTVDTLRDTIPANLGGVFFLSGGQGELEATKNLNEINKY